MEKTLREYQNQIDTMMSRALQLAQEQIKVYVDEQRRVCTSVSSQRKAMLNYSAVY